MSSQPPSPLSSQPSPPLSSQPPPPLIFQPPPPLLSQPPPPWPSHILPPLSEKTLLFCTTEIRDQTITPQPFATISIRDMLQLREQSNVTWEDVCKRSLLRTVPPQSSSNTVDDAGCSNSQTNTDTDQPTEIEILENDQQMGTDYPGNNSKLEQEIAELREENKKLCSENTLILSFVGELGNCLGVSWNDNAEGSIPKETLSESNLQLYLDRLKQVLQKGEDDKLELEKLKELEHSSAVDLEEKTMIDRDSQTTFSEVVNPPTIPRRKKGVCKVIGTNLQEYWCSCGRTFAHRDRIAAHIKINKLSWKFKCTECTLKFADLKTLKAHMATTHKIKNPIGEFNRGCIFCGKMFELAEELTQHTENHKKEWVKNRKPVKMVKTTNQDAPHHSLGYKAKKMKRTKQTVVVEPIKLTTNRKRTLFKCRLCTRTFSDHVRFQRHTSLEHRNEEA